MATIAEQLTSLANTKTAIKDAIVAKGVQVSDDTPFSGYADKIGEISGGGEPVEKTKFGASVDTWLGDVDADGRLNKPTWTGAVIFSGVKEINIYGLRHAFYGCDRITSVDLSSVKTILDNGMAQAFYNCSGINSVDLSSLQSVSGYGMSYTFYNCSGITSLNLSSLQVIDNNGLANAFYGCSGIKSVDLSSLQSVGTLGMTYTFAGCKSLSGISFASLTDIQSNSFGSAYSGAFYNCTGLTEIHFRADMQATIEAMDGYGTKWGATNATIYFDL